MSYENRQKNDSALIAFLFRVLADDRLDPRGRDIDGSSDHACRGFHRRRRYGNRRIRHRHHGASREEQGQQQKNRSHRVRLVHSLKRSRMQKAQPRRLG